MEHVDKKIKKVWQTKVIMKTKSCLCADKYAHNGILYTRGSICSNKYLIAILDA